MFNSIEFNVQVPQLNVFSSISILGIRRRWCERFSSRNGDWIEFRGLFPGTGEMHESERRVFAAKNFIEQFFALGRDPSWP